MSDPYQEMRSHFFENQGWKLRKCLAPSMRCAESAVRAHTVQNARTLELIAQDGHVIGFKIRIDKRKGPVVELKAIGRNAATTFTGLCAKHDAELFRKIDSEIINVDDVEQLHLLAYRPIIRELHASMEGAVKIQAGYKKRVGLGLDPEDVPSSSGLLAVEHMAKSWLIFRCKYDYEQHELNKEYDKVVHRVRVLRVYAPTIAASTFFGVNESTDIEDVEGISLNILPQDERSTLVVVSYLAKYSTSVDRKLGDLFEVGDEEFTFRLSKLVLANSEAVVLAPRYFAAWSLGKIRAVERFFCATIFDDCADSADRRLNLFYG